MNKLLKPEDAEQGLGVLQSTLPVVESARHVWIDNRALADLREDMIKNEGVADELGSRFQWCNDELKMATAILVLNAWNFCFWPDRGQDVWSIEHEGKEFKGYKALAFCVERALAEGLGALGGRVDRDEAHENRHERLLALLGDFDERHLAELAALVADVLLELLVRLRVRRPLGGHLGADHVLEPHGLARPRGRDRRRNGLLRGRRGARAVGKEDAQRGMDRPNPAGGALQRGQTVEDNVKKDSLK